MCMKVQAILPVFLKEAAEAGKRKSALPCPSSPSPSSFFFLLT